MKEKAKENERRRDQTIKERKRMNRREQKKMNKKITQPAKFVTLRKEMYQRKPYKCVLFDITSVLK